MAHAYAILDEMEDNLSIYVSNMSQASLIWPGTIMRRCLAKAWLAARNSRASASHHIGRDLLQSWSAKVVGHYLEYIGVAPLPA